MPWWVRLNTRLGLSERGRASHSSGLLTPHSPQPHSHSAATRRLLETEASRILAQLPPRLAHSSSRQEGWPSVLPTRLIQSSSVTQREVRPVSVAETGCSQVGAPGLESDTDLAEMPAGNPFGPARTENATISEVHGRLCPGRTAVGIRFSQASACARRACLSVRLTSLDPPHAVSTVAMSSSVCRNMSSSRTLKEVDSEMSTGLPR